MVIQLPSTIRWYKIRNGSPFWSSVNRIECTHSQMCNATSTLISILTYFHVLIQQWRQKQSISLELIVRYEKWRHASRVLYNFCKTTVFEKKTYIEEDGVIFFFQKFQYVSTVITNGKSVYIAMSRPKVFVPGQPTKQW